MRALVSILIPAFNVEHFLAETIRSALAQTWSQTELIIIDDGSKDGTLALAKSFESANVKVIAQENRGASAARNLAWRESQGEYIQYLDADDLLAPEKLEVQLRRLAEEDPGGVATCRWGRFVDSPASAWFVHEPFWMDLSPVDWLVSCWARVSMMHPGAYLVPRLLTDRAGPWDESLSLNDDGEYFARVVLASRRVLFCSDAISYYRSEIPNSLSGIKTPAAWHSAYRSLEKETRNLLQAENSLRTRQALANRFQEFIYAAYPDVPCLLRKAEHKVTALGGSSLTYIGGPRFSLVVTLAGWRCAKRLQRLGMRMKGLSRLLSGKRVLHAKQPTFPA
jgi:glycosyltransferase involved in cell wall biosynthesis